MKETATSPVHISKELHQRLKVAATDKKVSMRDYLEPLIERALSGVEKSLEPNKSYVGVILL